MATSLLQTNVYSFAEHRMQQRGQMQPQHCHRIPPACGSLPQKSFSKGQTANGSGQVPPSSLDAGYVVPPPAPASQCNVEATPVASTELKPDEQTDNEKSILKFIEQLYSGEDYLVAEAVGQMKLEKNTELVPMAQLIVTKALREPQHSEVCAILSRALHLYLPALPPPKPGKKAESFMHALLDAFQTEFEDLLSSPFELMDGQPTMVPSSKTHATVQFAGHLHRQSLLGTRVVSQMVQDLVGCGAVGCARELLRMIGVMLDNVERGNLGTVMEVPTEDTDEEAES